MGRRTRPPEEKASLPAERSGRRSRARYWSGSPWPVILFFRAVYSVGSIYREAFINEVSRPGHRPVGFSLISAPVALQAFCFSNPSGVSGIFFPLLFPFLFTWPSLLAE